MPTPTLAQNPAHVAARCAGQTPAPPGDCVEHGQRWEYGRVHLEGRNVPIHHRAYIEAKGPIPAGLQIDHLCFNPRCINPDHLEAVPFAVNRRRSRQNKLTAADVAKIRQDAARQERGQRGGYSMQWQRAVAADFGVSVRHLRKILYRKIWGDVEPARI